MTRLVSSLILFVSVATPAAAQQYSSSSIFAHNDYVHPVPFFSSYDLQVGFIEADVFLQASELLVAHTQQEIKGDRTLDELYLKPLLKKVNEHGGFVYADHEKTLTLMIDLKTEGSSTISMLVTKLKAYPALLSCASLKFAVSGRVPEPARWKDYPHFIFFDGRPNVSYSQDQLDRLLMISTDFKLHSTWNGEGIIPQVEREKITKVIEAAHANGKRIRFWGAPDFTNAWKTWMQLEIDILGTDDVSGLAAFITMQE